MSRCLQEIRTPGGPGAWGGAGGWGGPGAWGGAGGWGGPGGVGWAGRSGIGRAEWVVLLRENAQGTAL